MVEVSPRKEKAKINKRPVSISDTNPLWMKHPNECTDDEYKDFTARYLTITRSRCSGFI